MSHSRDQSQQEARTSSISKRCHEDEITNNAYFFRSLLGPAVIGKTQDNEGLPKQYDRPFL
jgi:hypothetical protein